MKRHTGNISSGSVLYYLLMLYLQNIKFAIVIFALHDSAVVDIPEYGQCLESAAKFINRHVP